MHTIINPNFTIKTLGLIRGGGAQLHWRVSIMKYCQEAFVFVMYPQQNLMFYQNCVLILYSIQKGFHQNPCRMCLSFKDFDLCVVRISCKFITGVLYCCLTLL